MTTQLSTKLAALAIALMVNSTMFGAVAYLFSPQFHTQMHVTGIARSLDGTHPATAV